MTNKKIPSTSQVRELFIVIRKNKEIPQCVIKEFCDLYFDRYAFIEHKEDIEPITGLVEGCHYHIYCHVGTKGVAKSTHLNNICKHFHFDNDDGICIEQVANRILCVQYLIHKNNPEKTPHKVEDVITNIPKDEFNNMMTSDCGELISFDMVYSLCTTSHRITEVIKALGITLYKNYRNVIWDIWNDVKKSQFSVLSRTMTERRKKGMRLCISFYIYYR